MNDEVLVDVQHINKRFKDKQVLFDVSFQIKKGRVVGLIGPNGAGKTTIMKAIAGLSDYENGEIQINGQRIDKNHTEQLKKVGSLIETPGIYPYMNALDNLRLYAPKATAAELKEITDKTAVTEFAKRASRKYSLGMKQRLGVAIALLNNPELVILDEPLNGLDPQTVRQMRDLIRSIADSGSSVLISSHILSELDLVADDIVIINKGKIISSTTRDQFELEAASNQSVSFEVRVQVGLDELSKELSANDFRVEKNSNSITVFLEKGQTINTFLTVLNKTKVEITYLSQNSQTLEDSVLDLIKEDK
ncbi:MAG: ATP-binding cassette domain-containing protein [Lactobacillaceae bacterium]|jgi:ABC-2 type transport system ATP-binding protein|nr:ATP-binding cassette domain-containing protein [Lactobacillaceae bacterium]